MGSAGAGHDVVAQSGQRIARAALGECDQGLTSPIGPLTSLEACSIQRRVITQALERLGMVDIVSDSDASGKVPGTDLREGVPTLTGLIALSTDDDPRLRELLTRPLDDDVDHAEALKRLRDHPALDAARLEAREWADRARQTLVALPEGGARDALTALCDYVVTRTG